MIIYPAIDIKNGKCVRLMQGKANCDTVFYDNPEDAAARWVKCGAGNLHIVDLDGAFKGKIVNTDIIHRIKERYDIFIETGGGIRTKEDIQAVLNAGADRAILGTAALFDEGIVDWAVSEYGDKIAVSIDAFEGKVAYKGWTGVSEVDCFDLIEKLYKKGIKTYIYTDIKRDGMKTGPDFDGTISISRRFPVNVIASGGIKSIDDIKTLKEKGIYGTIIGRAIYDGSIDLKEALEV